MCRRNVLDAAYQKTRVRKARVHQEWYLPASEWESHLPLAQRFKQLAKQGKQGAPFSPFDSAPVQRPVPPPAVAEDETQLTCAISGDSFVKYWDADKEAWYYKGAVRLTGAGCRGLGLGCLPA